MNQKIEQIFQVPYRYSVHFTQYLFSIDNTVFLDTLSGDGEKKLKRVIVFVDELLPNHHPNLITELQTYFKYYAELLELVCKPLFVPGGESIKNSFNVIKQIYGLISQHKICRHSYLVAIGGGAVLDAVGYAANTAHRGIRLIRVPTTVLSQNDSGVGVKSGINYLNKKNFIGTFSPPYAVINDNQFLTTLDDRTWRSGISEAIKVALIKDKVFFNFLKKQVEQLKKRNMQIMQNVIYRCAELHINHIGQSGDPFEYGSSRPLDFGHWAAHKLEVLTCYSLLHGEAVAIGLALDCTYSYLVGLLSKSSWISIIDLLYLFGFDLQVPELSQKSDLLYDGLSEFQEHLGGELTIMLLKDIGEGIEVNVVELPLYQKAVSMLDSFIEKRL